MHRGKDICKQLKEVRRRIADENDIPLEIKECTYEGPCRGTCPRCEAEVRYLESELERRIRLGRVATVAGLALSLAACGSGASGTRMDADEDVYEGEPLPPPEDTLLPQPPEPPHDTTLTLQGIIGEDEFVVPRSAMERMEHLSDSVDLATLQEPKCSTVNCEDFVVVRGESGAVVSYGHLSARFRSRLLVPQSTNEAYNKNADRDDRAALPPVVEVEEVDGQKIISDEQQR